ncbi:HAMP domain-containing sensor histidine kinase [Malaciobacter mytili]|uniref:sensor histidine kinase n=1 Tax=Malaciobacter mytili TaxID=603050 RepID=UPI003BAF2746
MLVEQLALTYKCHSAIGNSLDLKEMLKEVLKTFINETFALYGTFYLYDETKKSLNKIISIGKIKDFNIEEYKDIYDSFNILDNKNNPTQRVLILPLDRGIMFFIYSKKNMNMSFLGSMFQGLAHKLNISIDSCLNVKIMKKRNEKLKILALELERQRKELIEANKYKNDFLANMSHELKTPLNSIIVISSVMKKNKKGKLDEEQVRNMNIINNCGNDLLILINDILDISKIEAGELALNLKKVNIEVLIDNLYESMKPLSDEKNLKFIKTFEIDNTDILTDESRLKQIIKNLLSNAFKFTENGKVEIKVKADIENIFISVIDEGIGISKDKLLNIFDRFKQADGSTTRKHGGTGLGLAISKELAHLLGGDIKVSSEVNMGSDFQVILPKKAIIKNISDDKVDISSGEDTVKTDEIVFFNMEDSLKLETIEEVDTNRLNNLLIINGDHSLLFSILVAFKKDGVNIEHTNSIENAQKVLQNSIFDALIIDIENSKEQNIKELIKVAKKNNTLFVAVGDEKIEDIDVNISRKSIDSSFVKRVQNLVKAKKENLD